MESTTETGSVAPIRVLVCIRYALFREGVKTVLSEGDQIVVVGEASSGWASIELVKRVKADVILLDPTMPDYTGSQMVRRMKAIDPKLHVVLLSMGDDEPIIASCMEAGAAASVRKEDHALNLRRTINRACGRDARAA